MDYGFQWSVSPTWMCPGGKINFFLLEATKPQRPATIVGRSWCGLDLSSVIRKQKSTKFQMRPERHSCACMPCRLVLPKFWRILGTMYLPICPCIIENPGLRVVTEGRPPSPWSCYAKDLQRNSRPLDGSISNSSSMDQKDHIRSSWWSAQKSVIAFPFSPPWMTWDQILEFLTDEYNCSKKSALQ